MIASREELQQIVSNYQKEGKKVAFTSGVFDLLHSGHVQYLAEAKTLADILIVGVNSDSSVRENKGPLRPIQGEESRAAVVEGLAAVDHVFLFSEKNNNENIKALKLDIYVKAGDYDLSKLSSAPLVKEYGGEIKLVSFQDGHSSTSLVDTVIERYLPQLVSYDERELPEAQPAVFLDRDGTLCEHIEYLHEPEKFVLLPGVIAGLKQLREKGFRLVVITNQPGIGLGYFTKEDFFRVNKEMFRQLSAEGILIDKVYFSPYSKADKTACRKPGTALGERAITELNLIRESSWMIGDMSSDVAFAKALGCKSCLVQTGQEGKDGLHSDEADIVAESFLAAAEQIIKAA